MYLKYSHKNYLKMCLYLCSASNVLDLKIPACVSVQQVSLSSGENSCLTGMCCEQEHKYAQN